MKKFVLSIALFVLVFILFVIVKPALAVEDQNERWSQGGKEYSVQRDGNNITLTVINPKVSRAAGIASLVGSINGTVFTGKQYLLADGCPSLEGYVPASGTVSADGNSIRVTFTNSDFFIASCTVDRSFEASYTYTKISPQNTPAASVPTVKPSPTPTETPLDLNGTWTAVNEKGTSFTFSGRHSGTSLTMQITNVSDDVIKDAIGKNSLSGTLLGHAFSGTGILIPYAPECLGRYFTTDATGTVAADGLSIAVSYTNFKYKVSTCAKVPGSEFTGSITYSKVNTEKKPTSTDKAKQVSPTPEITKAPEGPSVGVSSRDFRSLAQANAQFQRAQADLEQIKKDKDPRWENNRNFANDYNSQPQTESNTVPSTLDVIQERLGQTADGSSVYLDIKDIYDQYVKGEAASYTGVSLVTDVANGVIKFTELTNRGVSVTDATSKTVIDTVGTGSLYLLPPVKLADVVATMPDRVLNTLGFSENSSPRKVTGFLKDNSPSAFIELSTQTMIETGNWTNLGGAVGSAWDDLRSAQGFGERAQATLDLVGTAVGAVPVAIAMQLRDEASTLFTVLKFGASGAGNIVSNWFTYPN